MWYDQPQIRQQGGQQGMNWLQSHYNLICHAHGDTEVFRNKSGTGRFPKARLFEHTNAQVSQHYSSDLSRLAELPTLVVAEALPGGNAQTPAFLSRLDRVYEWGNEILFDFHHLYGRMCSEDIFRLEGLHFDPWEHSRTDQLHLESIISDYRIESENGFEWNNDRINQHFDDIDFSDPKGTARTWTVVLMSMLMDQRYLHL